MVPKGRRTRAFATASTISRSFMRAASASKKTSASRGCGSPLPLSRATRTPRETRRDHRRDGPRLARRRGGGADEVQDREARSGRKRGRRACRADRTPSPARPRQANPRRRPTRRARNRLFDGTSGRAMIRSAPAIDFPRDKARALPQGRPGTSARGSRPRLRLRLLGLTDLHANLYPYDYYRDRPDDLRRSRPRRVPDREGPRARLPTAFCSTTATRFKARRSAISRPRSCSPTRRRSTRSSPP